MRRSFKYTALVVIAPMLLASGCSGLQDNAFEKAQEAYAAGQYGTAQEFVISELKAEPDNEAARMLYARILLELGNGTRAESELKKLSKSAKYGAEAKALLPKAAFLEGRLDKALELTETISGPFAHHMAWARAFALISLDRNDEARTVLREALEAQPDDPELRLLQGHMLLADGKVEEARKLADDLSKKRPKVAQVMLFKGQVALAQGDRDGAFDAFKKAVESQPENPIMLAALGDSYRAAEDLDKAKEYYGRALSVAPGSTIIQLSLAEVEFFSGNEKIAKEIIQNNQAAIEAMPGGLRLSGFVAAEEGNHNTAVAKLTPYLERQPGDALAWAALADSHQALKNAGAEKEARAKLARLESGSGQLETAVQDAKSDMRRELDRANQAIGKERWQEADRIYSSLATGEGSTNPVVFNNAAMVKLQLGDKAGALKMARRAYQLMPDDPYVRDTLGWTLFMNNKDIETASQHLTAAYRALPDNLEISWHLAQVLAAADKRKEAIALMERLRPGLPASQHAELNRMIAQLKS
ncbi:tetratricopeptide repeat protein [Erythrobacter aureus]|uniref:Tetratricopeptide repeat protein n=1 Tax=Erythrobacter aureus TaxID=2182384 RepID=A0A345YB51_9SPHN|nr:tetratricopeptide repeat protein [Erythrobacter aureus]AXK41153.1 tetratricopeptide repeat protein [Erythrobacter aureus]